MTSLVSDQIELNAASSLLPVRPDIFSFVCDATAQTLICKSKAICYVKYGFSRDICHGNMNWAIKFYRLNSMC
jgi:hypothetical protein